jgi:hypothetical protein
VGVGEDVALRGDDGARSRPEREAVVVDRLDEHRRRLHRGELFGGVGRAALLLGGLLDHGGLVVVTAAQGHGDGDAAQREHERGDGEHEGQAAAGLGVLAAGDHPDLLARGVVAEAGFEDAFRAVAAADAPTVDEGAAR